MAEDGTPVAAFEAVWPPSGFEPPSKVARAWARLGEADRKAAIDGAAPFRAACQRARRKPGAASAYLSQRKWEVRAVTSRSAAEGGFYPLLGTPAERAWFEVYAEERVARGYSRPRDWPDFMIVTDPKTQRRAILRKTLFPPNAQGPPIAAD